MKTILKKIAIFLFAFGAIGAVGCKDSEQKHDAAKLEICKINLDDGEWDDAIDNCADVDSSEGKHLTAQAYMGRAGLNLSSLISNIDKLTDDPGDALFSYIPDSTQEKEDYRMAVSIIMKEIDTRTNLMNWEVMLMTGILVLGELKDLVNLTLTDGNFSTCASTNISNCSFSPKLDTAPTPDKVNYNGLGTNFYKGLCDDITPNSTVSSTVGADNGTDTSGDPHYDFTIHKCTIQNTSLLYYNKIAYEAYDPTTDRNYSVLNFYDRMDVGGDYTVDVNGSASVALCGKVSVATTGDEDLKLNDCGIFNFLANPGL